MDNEIEFQPSAGREQQQPAQTEEVAAVENTTVAKMDGHLIVNSEFSSSQLSQMAQQEVDAGRLTLEEANRMLAADGVGPLKAPVDPNSPEAYVDSIMPPADPKQFSMPEIRFEDDPTGQEARAVDQIARGWLSEGRFTREIGTFLAEEVSRNASRFEKMNEAERRGWKSEQAVMLQKVFKGDTGRMIKLAKSLVNHIEARSPGLKAMLESTGAGDNAMVISKFALQAQLLLERQPK